MDLSDRRRAELGATCQVVSLAKGHLWLIYSVQMDHVLNRSTDLHYAWLRRCFRCPARGSGVSYTFWQEGEGYHRVVSSWSQCREKELWVCLGDTPASSVEAGGGPGEAGSGEYFSAAVLVFPGPWVTGPEGLTRKHFQLRVVGGLCRALMMGFLSKGCEGPPEPEGWTWVSKWVV